jgi:hypothetical protein
MPSCSGNGAWKGTLWLVLLAALSNAMTLRTLAAPISPVAAASRLHLSPEVKTALSDIYSGDFEAVIQITQKVRKEDPNQPLSYVAKAETHGGKCIAKPALSSGEWWMPRTATHSPATTPISPSTILPSASLTISSAKPLRPKCISALEPLSR